MSARRGVVLPVVVFFLVVLGVVTTALLVLSVQQERIARARTAVLRARLAAESAVRTVVAEWSTGRYRGLPVGAVRVVETAGLPGDGRYRASVERLTGNRFLVHGHGWVDTPHGPAGEARAAAVVRGLAPAAFHDAFPAAFTAGGGVRLSADAVVDGAPPEPAPPGWPGRVCGGGGQATGPGLVLSDASDLRAAPGARISGTPSVAADAAATAPATFRSLGPLTWEALRRLADRVVGGSVRPGPRQRDGACVESAHGNWGDPWDPDGPCGDYFPLIYAEGDLDISGGAGQGVLVVRGDLALAPGARFVGPVLVQGRVRLGEDARIDGAVRAAGTDAPSVLDGTVAYRRCALERAFAASPALNRPFRPGPRWWIPVF